MIYREFAVVTQTHSEGGIEAVLIPNKGVSHRNVVYGLRAADSKGNLHRSTAPSDYVNVEQACVKRTK